MIASGQNQIVSKKVGKAYLVSLLFLALLSCDEGTGQNFTTCGSGGVVPPSSNPLNISRTPCSSGSPAFAQANGVLYVVWMEPDVGNGDIFFSRSTNGGISFSTAANLSATAGISGNPTTGNSGSPAIAADGNNVYVTWEELTEGPSTEVYFMQSADGGVTFGAAKKLSDAAGLTTDIKATHTARSPAVAAKGSTIWVAWEEDVNNIADPTHVLPQYSEILISASTDGGTNFGSAQGISRSSTKCGGTGFGMFSYFPSLTTTSTSVYAVWQENTEFACTATTSQADIFLSQASLSSPTAFSSDPKTVALTAGNSFFASIAATSGFSPATDIIHVVWTEFPSGGNNTETYYDRSSDGGATFFSPPINLSNTPDDASGTPALAVEGENMIVVWNEAKPDIQGIVAVRSTTAISGSPSTIFPMNPIPTNVSQTNASASLPKVLLSVPTVYLVWVDSSPGNPEIVFRSFPF